MVAGADVVLIATKAFDSATIANILRPEQIVIDLVRAAHAGPLAAQTQAASK
jgi:hypothetical protein